MGHALKILFLLLQKNYIIRKRHWIGTITEIAIPAGIFALLMGVRTLLSSETTYNNSTTTYNVLDKSYWQQQISANLLYILYQPQDEFTNRIMENVTGCMGTSDDRLLGFDTEAALLTTYQVLQTQNPSILALAILFDGTNGEIVPTDLVYTIKPSTWISSILLDIDYGGPSIVADFLVTGIPLVALQMCVDDLFILEVAPDSLAELAPTRFIQKMPYPPYETSNFGEAFFRTAINDWVAIAFIVTLFMIPSYITVEKEIGVIALVKMNGVKAYQNSLSWLISGMVLGTIVVTLIVIVLKTYFTSDQLPFYYYSNGFILWLALFINLTHTYAFCLHIASYFHKPRYAQGVAVITVFVVRIIATQLETNQWYGVLPYLGFLFPNAAAIRIFQEFNGHEDSLDGAQWTNLFETKHEVLGFDGTLGFLMIFSILATIFHFLIALYVEAVIPGKYGVAKSPLFFLKCFTKNKENNNNCTVNTEDSDDRPKILENVTDGVLTPGIQIRNLTKSFSTGCHKSKTIEAVRGISLDFYKGEITALLGHNGAGKTTTMSILTGLTSPTLGTVIINGKNITRDNMQEITKDLGTCPQENTLFPDLTVLEHLRFFGMLKLKKKTNKQVMQDVEDLLVKLKISEKRNVLPANLSGGQKRRVCLGIALIGDASILVLDEPTSGMDPETSRVTWDILLKYRKQKTILITTHSMAEADVLGDRIAIMHAGKMECYGSSMFLKKHYGEHCQEVTLSIEPWCDQGKIQAIVGAEADIDSTIYGRIVIKIPITDSLPEILDKIESMKVELGITGMSVSTITLEEVFLRTAETYEENEQEANVDRNELGAVKLTGSQLTKQVFCALMAKKLTYATNHYVTSLAIIFGTLAAVILMSIFNFDLSDIFYNGPINLSSYPNSEALIYGENATLVNTYKAVIESQGGSGTLIGTEIDIISALLAKAKEGLAYYRNNIIISAEFNSTNESVLVNGLYSGSAMLSAPITVNVMSNVLLKASAGDQYSISANIGDLPQLGSETEQLLTQVGTLVEMMLFVPILFIVAALFIIHPLLETTTTFKQLQRITGVSSVLYWGTMFIFDYALYFIATGVTVTVLVARDFIFDLKTYRSTEIGIIVLLLLLFGINALLEAYALSFYKKPLYISLLILCSVNIVIAQVQILVTQVLQSILEDTTVLIIQRRIFSFLPHVSFTFAFSKFLEVASSNARCRGLSNSYIQVACSLNDTCCGLGCADGSCRESLPYFEGFGTDGSLDEFVLYLALTPIAFLVIILLLENGVFQQLVLKLGSAKQRPVQYPEIVDSNVAAEKNIIRQAINQREKDSSFNDENVFLAYELSKRYGKVEAVKEVNFRVKNNECFGLLGVNGAGKSTTFRMLVGEDLPTGGILIRGNENIKSNRKEYLAGIGYCSQMNALIPSFNAFEHLSLFARLRGIPSPGISSEVQLWINRLGLNNHAHNSSESYSGGNKRRLNIAVALIASPEIVLLDEPTAGVDPQARRLLWGTLQRCQTSGQAIILTSHSMEECEALCNRLLIMVNGQLVCVGASQELKQRFGAGYDITVKLNPERTEVENMEIKRKIEAALDCELRDEHPGYLLYHIMNSQTTWVRMFGIMNLLKSEHSCIEDYAVSSATLEQLFIQLARSAPTLASVTSTINGTNNGLGRV